MHTLKEGAFEYKECLLIAEKKENEEFKFKYAHSKQIHISNFVPYGLWEIFLHTDKTIQKLQKVKEKLFFEEKPHTQTNPCRYV